LDEIIRRHTRQLGHFLASEAKYPAARPCGEADIGGSDAVAPTPEQYAQLG
jgi:hypothetical protein